MGRLRSLPEEPGPGHDLVARLRELHLLAGEPSMRDVARSTALSHDTVHRVLTETNLPRWGTLELVVEALDGDVKEFHGLWVTARRTMDRDRD